MGNVCTSNEGEKATIECPHKFNSRGKGKAKNIRLQISQDIPCPLCRELKQIKQKNEEARLSDARSQISLTSQNVEDYTYQDTQRKVKQSKFGKKTITDFEVVRGLGKGAFGRVYLIKERQNHQEPLHPKQDIMSLNLGQFQDEEYQIPEEVSFQKIASQEPIKYSPQKIQKNQKQNISNANLPTEETPKPKLTSSKLQQTSLKFGQAPRFYALKILNKKQINSQQEKKQAISERYILEAMNHPFIVKLHYAFQTKSRLFLIVDLLAGGQLFYLLRKLKKFDQDMTRFYAAQILLALEYLHDRSIIYRDLKPENILLDSEGHVKITDFGLSKVMYSANQKTYSLCGTPEYIAPQVIIGGGYTQAADWFSFGSLMYDMLTGRPPFLNNNKSLMLKNLISHSVPLPAYLSDNCKSLLSGLFKIKPQERLGFKNGANQIKKHPFFKGIDFLALQNRKIKPPVSFMDYNLETTGEEYYVNNNGFQKWNSWHMHMQSPQAKKTKESKQHFQGFTYQNCDFEFYEEQQTPGGQQNSQAANAVR